MATLTRPSASFSCVPELMFCQAVFACGGLTDLLTLLAPPVLDEDGRNDQLEAHSIKVESPTSKSRSRSESAASDQRAPSQPKPAFSNENEEREVKHEVSGVLSQNSSTFASSVFDTELRPLHWAPRRREFVNPLKPTLSAAEFASVISTIAFLVKTSASMHRAFVASDGCVDFCVDVTLFCRALFRRHRCYAVWCTHVG